MTSARRRPAIELLESRSLYSTGTVNAHFGAIPDTIANMNTQAVAATELPNGQVLALGCINYGQNDWHNMFIRYNADGSLDRTFGNGGLEIESTSRMRMTSYAWGITAMPDGSALVDVDTGAGSLARLTTAGQFDMTYGKKGILNVELSSMRRQADGTTLGVIESGTSLQLVRLDAHGNLLHVSAQLPYKKNGRIDGQVLANGLVATIGTDGDNQNQLTLTNTGFQPVDTFGVNGKFDLPTMVKTWMSSQGPWYDASGLDKSPYWRAMDVSVARDGGYVVDAALYALRTKPTAAELENGPTTWIHVHLSAQGKLISVNGDDQRSATAFYGTYGTLNGTLHFDHGADVAVSGPSVVGIVQTSVAAPKAFFIFDTLGDFSTVTHFAVSVMKPPGATISGTLFNDHDHDGVFDAGETINADRTVYLDLNNKRQAGSG